jgi:hypothetical protein
MRSEKAQKGDDCAQGHCDDEDEQNEGPWIREK